MRQIEDRFNHQFHYPWVFLNDEPFTQEFRILTAGMASGEVEYGLIDNKKEWSTPAWIDTERAQEAMEEMVRKDVIYGGSVSYRYPLISPYAISFIDICVGITLDSFSDTLC
jgi:alpha 1,2-mannosyltransferase